MTDPVPDTAATADEPEVSDRTADQWGFRNPDKGNVVIISEDRNDVERLMRGLSRSMPNLLLVKRSVRTRVEKWLGPVEVVPWHAPCDWVAEANADGKQIGPSWCMEHKHSEGTPVPPDHIRGAEHA